MNNDTLKEFEGIIESGSRDEFLLLLIDPKRLPSHVAIIMDGNGRWAARRRQPRDSCYRHSVAGLPAGELFEAVIEFQKRERRYGDIKPSAKGRLIAANMK